MRFVTHYSEFNAEMTEQTKSVWVSVGFLARLNGYTGTLSPLTAASSQQSRQLTGLNLTITTFLLFTCSSPSRQVWS